MFGNEFPNEHHSSSDGSDVFVVERESISTGAIGYDDTQFGGDENEFGFHGENMNLCFDDISNGDGKGMLENWGYEYHETDSDTTNGSSLEFDFGRIQKTSFHFDDLMNSQAHLFSQ